MNKIILVCLLLVLVACGNRNVDAYEDVIARVDRMVVVKGQMNDSIVLNTPESLAHLKDVFRRSITPIDVDTVFADQLILLYEEGERIGVLSISNAEKPVVGFYTDSLVFSFKMTYGIGLFLSEVSAGSYD